MSNTLMFVTKRNGTQEVVKFDKITTRIKKLIKPEEAEYVDPILISQKVVATIFSGITTTELDTQSAEICVNLSTQHHYYSDLAGRILVSSLHKRTTNHFVDKMTLIQKQLGFLDEKWLTWIKKHKKEINGMIDYERDYIFDYFGFKTLERAYLLKIKNEIIERPQDMYMRVASFLNQGDLDNTKKTYDMLSLGYYTHATPTLFNSANKRSQCSSCFLIGTDDSIEGITHTWDSVSKISKWGGGIGLHVSNIRAKDSIIRGTNGPSSGIIPMLKVYNEIARYINQCFTSEVKVYTEKGLTKMENIKPGDKVYTKDGSLQEVKKVYCDAYDKEILNIGITHDYENIKVTPEHPFWVVKNQPPGTNFKLIVNRLEKGLVSGDWVDAKEITKNDLIGFPIPKHFIDNPSLDDADCYMYGLMLGDGHICKNEKKRECGLTLGFKKDKQFEFTKKYLEQNGIHYWVNTTESTNQIRWMMSSKFKFVRAQLYDIKDEKYFDYNMLNLPIEKAKWIVKGLLETDGSIGKEIQIEMSSQNVIDGIKYILLKMGILVSGYSRDRTGQVSESKNIVTRKPTYMLRIPKVDEITTLLGVEKGEHVKYIKHKDMLYTRIKEISKETIEEPVYDLEIMNNHNYLTQAGLVHNGGKRKGSIAIYLEPWHPDILAFLDLRKNFGAETERARDLFLAVWVPDLFMKKVQEDGDWYTFCPDECPGLADSWGEKFETLYNKYIEEKKYRQKYEARKVMKAILDSQLETGTPYIVFKDTANRKSNQQNIGTIKSSNLCSEILLYSDAKEYAVCNLASIAINSCVKPFKPTEKFMFYSKPLCKNSRYIRSFLKYHKWDFEEKSGFDESKNLLTELKDKEVKELPVVFYGEKKLNNFNELFLMARNTFDFDKLEEISYIASKNVDKVIDVNYYPTIETKYSNMRHRPIGVGIQGVADALVSLKIAFDSDEAVAFNSKMMESIYYACVKASVDIAKSRHDKMKKLIESKLEVPEFYDSNFQIQDKDLNNLYHEMVPCKYEMKNTKYPGAYSTFEGSPFSKGVLQFDMWGIKPSMTEKWDELKKELVIYGVRNSQLTSLMPTASTSQILGNNECFEMFTNSIYTRRTLAGDFPVVNSYLMDDLLSVGLWSSEMKDLILAYKGSIQEINGIPEQIKKLYPTVWEIKQSWTLKHAIARGPYVDQTQSMNIFMAVPDYQKLYSSHMFAWTNGLKTGIYYLRTRPAEDATKITIDPNIKKLNESSEVKSPSKEKKFKKPEEGETCEMCSS
jgi:ribonucleoside-diphosphate reductase alpha chain